MEEWVGKAMSNRGLKSGFSEVQWAENSDVLKLY